MFLKWCFKFCPVNVNGWVTIYILLIIPFLFYDYKETNQNEDILKNKSNLRRSGLVNAIMI